VLATATNGPEIVWARIVPASCQAASPVSAASRASGADASSAGTPLATEASSAIPNTRHQLPSTSCQLRRSASAPRWSSTVAVCGTKYQRTARKTPGTTSSISPAAIPIAASRIARNSGAKASRPRAIERRADGGRPSAASSTAWIVIAASSGAETR
jgi:hypothetical protein